MCAIDLTAAGRTMDYTNESTYRATRADLERAITLIPDAYRAPAFHDVERQQVWSRGWVCVGYTSQVEDSESMMPVEVAGQPLLLRTTW